jgi:glucuronate isomerase
MLGNDIHAGLIPADRQLVGTMVENICYKNAAAYFGLEAGKL